MAEEVVVAFIDANIVFVLSLLDNEVLSWVQVRDEASWGHLGRNPERSPHCVGVYWQPYLHCTKV